MFEIFDDYCWTKQKKVLIHDRHHVPGLGNFAHWNFTESVDPSPLHFHTNMIEIHCMVKGQRYTTVETAGTVSRFVATGNQVIMTFPLEVHSNGNMPQAPCEFYAFQVDVSDPSNMFGLNPEYSRELVRQLNCLRDNRLLNMNVTHLNYLISAFNFFAEQTAESTRIGVQFLTCFLFTLQFLTPAPAETTRRLDEGIARSIDYLEEHICENLRLERVAKNSGYSLSRFKIKFKAETGITPAEYITLKKIELAKARLLQGDESITDIAYALGFSTSNYFASVFKKILSCTPREYRKAYGSEGPATYQITQ